MNRNCDLLNDPLHGSSKNVAYPIDKSEFVDAADGNLLLLGQLKRHFF
jgi:hypothetical protein